MMLNPIQPPHPSAVMAKEAWSSFLFVLFGCISRGFSPGLDVEPRWGPFFWGDDSCIPGFHPGFKCDTPSGCFLDPNGVIHPSPGF